MLEEIIVGCMSILHFHTPYPTHESIHKPMHGTIHLPNNPAEAAQYVQAMKGDAQNLMHDPSPQNYEIVKANSEQVRNDCVNV